ncbi:hypothetical protein WG954_20155 [Lacibacter sp. H375]|uniref:hypothetical protein n=1 Tax=Lacibacter sp. H375 TaxID=3133424 RepID=UPI0030BCF4D1
MKISIAGARLSHLVQKDKIWDHGSMAEHARIIFYLLFKSKAGGDMESLKRQCSLSCFEKIKAEIERGETAGSRIITPIVKELAIVDVQPGKNNKPDMFCAVIKYHVKETINGIETMDHSKLFLAKWSFIRQGDWWMLDEIKR